MSNRGKNGFVVNHAIDSVDTSQGRTLGDKRLTWDERHKTDTRTGTQAPGSPEVAKAPSEDAKAGKGASGLNDVKGTQAPGVPRTAQAPTGGMSSDPASSATSAADKGLFSSARNKAIAGIVGAAVVLGGVGVGVSASKGSADSTNGAPSQASSSSSSSSSSGWFSGVYGDSSYEGSSSGTTDTSTSSDSGYDPSSGEAPRNARELQDYLKSNGLDVSSDAGRKSSPGSSESSGTSASSASSSTPSQVQTVNLGSTGLQIEDMRLNRTFSSAYNCDVVSVTGILRNSSSGSRYNYVTVRLALYDASGTELGTQSVIFTGVAPGNSQPFTESAFSANPRTVSSATSVKVVDFATG